MAHSVVVVLPSADAMERRCVLESKIGSGRQITGSATMANSQEVYLGDSDNDRQ